MVRSLESGLLKQKTYPSSSASYPELQELLWEKHCIKAIYLQTSTLLYQYNICLFIAEP